MERFGEYLKAHREKKSIRLEEIASITKIHLHSLELLEANQWEQLPPEPFIRGFIIAYAKYVGLDAKETIARYLEDIGHNAVDLGVAQQATPIPAGESPNDVIQNAWQLPTKKIAGAAAVLGVIFLLGIFIYVGRSESDSKAGQITETRPQSSGTSTLSVPNPSVSSSASAPTTLVTGKGPTDDNRNVASPELKASESLKTAEAGKTDAKVSTPEKLDTKIALKASPLAQDTKALLIPSPSVAPLTPPATAKTDPKLTDAKTKVAEVKKTPAPSPSPNLNVANASAGGEEFKHDVAIEGKVRTWIKIVIDDKMPVEYFLPKGEKAAYKAKNKIKVVLGDSTGATVTHNGEVNKGKKFKGTIHSYIFPANARFPQDIPKRTTTDESSDNASLEDPLLQ